MRLLGRIPYWLETARELGGEPAKVYRVPHKTWMGYNGPPEAKADQSALIWSRKELEDFGCITR